MKKILFLVTILALSVFTTACINNLAVQELNNKAAEYMQKGDYENAISRLKSSVDLDPSVFETQYNLAVAYTENEDYEDAIEAYKAAINIKSDSKDAYYSMAVMYENYAKDLFAGNTKEQKEKMDNEEDDEDNKTSLNEDGTFKPTESDIEKVKQYYNSSIEAYEKYLELAADAKDASDVDAHIQELRTKLETLGTDTN
ncbi:tetratricopeptide repeat protein [bacterium]|nr:tetratricopeptide repeat protein [bacterium]